MDFGVNPVYLLPMELILYEASLDAGTAKEAVSSPTFPSASQIPERHCVTLQNLHHHLYNGYA